MNSNILIFLGTNYRQDPPQIEFFLPKYLSQTRKIYCFEYPRIINLINLLLGKNKLLENINRNLSVYRSFALLPFGRTFKFINSFNHRLNFSIFNKQAKWDCRDFTVITFTPELSLVDFKNFSRKTFYHILDNYTSLPWWKNILAERQFNHLEKNLLENTGEIIVVSETLYKKYSKTGKKIHLFRTPADITGTYFKSEKIPPEMKTLKKPVAGFIGTMFEFKIDISLLKKLIGENPDITFVFLGKLKFRYRKNFRLVNNRTNSFYLGYVKESRLPDFISNFDAGIIPYRTDSYGQFAWPVKIMQFLALGIPVISTPLPAVQYLADKKLIYTASTSDDFITLLKSKIGSSSKLSIRNKRIKEALKNSWSGRIGEYLKIISD